MCLPNVICSSVSLMWSVSTMSDSLAKGWFLLADSLLGILFLISWNLCNMCDCIFWKAPFSIDAQISLKRRETGRAWQISLKLR